MSLIPERHICPDCGGYDMTGMGQFGRNLKSVCRCEEKEAGQLTSCVGDPLLKRRVA